MTTQRHSDLVNAQFGEQAAAYVTSIVHATGEDLQQLADMIDGMTQPVRALDLGCGGGHVSFALAPHVTQVVAYDLSVDMLAAVAATAADRNLPNILTRQGVAESLPFPDGSFDFVTSRYSAHHWRDFVGGLREARRVLKNTGRAAFVDVVAPDTALFSTHLQTIELLRDTSHVRNYAVSEWRQGLREAGFEPGRETMRRLRLDFDSWVTRMRTPALHVAAIRALQAGMPTEVADYLELEADGSFTIDTMTIEAAPK
jgi:ubiquinone/menaquinone biosynthesis C-methylase UbiE